MSEPGRPLQYERFTRLNRGLHVVMIVSFMSLALTGLTLKFSYTGWARTLSRLLGGFEAAGWIHRFGAVLMIGLFTTHLADLWRRKRREYGQRDKPADDVAQKKVREERHLPITFVTWLRTQPMQLHHQQMNQKQRRGQRGQHRDMECVETRQRGA